MKNISLFLSIFIITTFFVTKVNAQSSSLLELKVEPKQSALKAAYLDWNSTATWAAGSDGRFANSGGGLTLITRKNWIYSGKITSGSGESPQKPTGYYPYRNNAGNSSGGGFFGGGPIISTNLGGYSQTNRSNSECRQACKDYKMTSLFAGKMLYHPNTEKVRMSIQGGVTFLKLEEAVDFLFYPGNGYKFSQEKYHKIGASARLGFEVPFSRYIGFSVNLEGTIAKNERLFGFGIGIMVGLLRGKK